MTTDIPPAPPRHHRGFLGLDRSGWWPALAVLGVALALAVGLPVVNSLVPNAHPIEPGTVLPVGRGIKIVPPDGWNLDVSAPRTDEVVITRALVDISVKADDPLQETATAASVLDALESQLSHRGGVRFLGERATIRTQSGLTGLMRGFLSGEEQGVIAVVSAPAGGDPSHSTFVEVVARGPTGAFLTHQAEVLELIRSIHSEARSTS